MCTDYLVHGAEIKCSCGSLECQKLKVTNNTKYSIGDDQLVAVKNDANHPDNIPKFGTCAVTGSQCEPVVVGNEWIGTLDDSVVAGAEAVTTDSCAVCMLGGIILPQSSGQDDIIQMLEQINEHMKEHGAYLGPFTKDPVHIASGNFVMVHTDLTIEGRSPLAFKRTYNGNDMRQTSIGYGWRHSHDISLINNINSIEVTFEDGHIESFNKKSGHLYEGDHSYGTVYADRNGYKLKKTIDGKLCVYTFSLSGMLLSLKDTSDFFINYIYDNNNRLIEIKNISGHLKIKYNKNNHVCQIEDGVGRSIKYDYNAASQLIRVTNANEQIWQYEYDQQGHLTQSIPPTGEVMVQNQYDSKHRVINQLFPDGGKMNFIYDIANKRTVITEQNGKRIKYYRDDDFRIIKHVDINGYELYEYNDKNKITLHQDKNGNIRKYEYDASGNLVIYTDPLGNAYRYNRNNDGTVIQINPDGSEVLSYYDKYGNIIRYTDELGREYCFNYTGNLLSSVRISDGSLIKLSRDTRDNINQIVNAIGGVFNYKYDDSNRVIEFKDGNSNITKFRYNNENEVTEIQLPNTSVVTYHYDEMGRLSEAIDVSGTRKWSYNENGNLSKYIDKEGQEVSYIYDKMWNVSSIKFADGSEIKYKYNKDNKLFEITDEDGGTTKYKYDANGNIIKTIYPDGYYMECKYDALDREIERIGPDGMKMNTIYDCMGRVIEVIDNNGQSTNFKYDKAGQLIDKIDVLGRMTTYTYDEYGNIQSIKEADGAITCYEYYSGSLLKSIIEPTGEKTEYVYDNNQNIIKKILPNKSEIQYVYDCMDQLIKVINADGQIEHYYYDKIGNIIQIIDGNGNSVEYSYTAESKINSIIDAYGSTMKFEYDSRGNLSTKYKVNNKFKKGGISEQHQEKLWSTEYIRDCKGRITGIIDSNGKEEIYRYDVHDRIIEKKDRDGYITKIEYTPVGKLAKIDYSGEHKVEFVYNSLRQLTDIYDWSGDIHIERDKYGRPTTVLSQQDEVSYSWSCVDMLQEIIYPSGKKIKYEYDLSKRPLAIIDTSQDQEYSFSYDRCGELIKRSYGDHIFTLMDYTNGGALKTTSSFINGEKFLSYRYHYDKVNNITGINKYIKTDVQTRTENCFTYEYDKINRLICSKRDGTIQGQYEYDPIGNMLMKNQNGERTHYKFDQMCRMVGKSTNNINLDYDYDNRGNITAIREGANIICKYNFDSTNMLVNVESPDENIQFKYNGIRQRIAKVKFDPDTNLKLTTTFSLDFTKDIQNLLERQENGTSTYVWSDHDLIHSESGLQNTLFFDDHNSSPVISLNQNNNQMTYHQFDDFGRSNTILPDCGYGFAGYYHDQSNLLYAYARYYCPIDGRFMSRDQLPARQPANLYNHYAYCYNSPIVCCDPNGLIALWVAGAIVGAVANVAAKAVTDVVDATKNYIQTGEFKTDTSWQQYVGAAVGGAVEGVTVVTTGNRHLAAAAGGATEELTSGLTTMASNKITGKEQDETFLQLLLRSGYAAGQSAIFQLLIPDTGIKIDGVTSGRNSYSAIWSSLQTKFQKGSIKNCSISSLYKGLVSESIDKLLTGTIEYIIKSSVDDLLTFRLMCIR